MDIYQQSLDMHRQLKGKLSVESKVKIETKEDLSLAYTPGVAEPCRQINKNPEEAYECTIKNNTIAVITDGSAVLGLGNIGGLAGLPVMEGKCQLLKRFGGINAFPICLDTQDPEEIIKTVKHIAPVFGGINLEDIAAPNCFVIEERLKQELKIPVFHDDQHGTAVVVLAALINSLKLTNQAKEEIKVVISGAGAAGIAIGKLLLQYGVKNVILCDRQGAIHRGRAGLETNQSKQEIAALTNPNNESGTFENVIKNANVFVGVSGPGLMTSEMVKTMAEKPIIFALANPTPEIMPEEAQKGGAYIIGTGRSDYPNQINNVLAFPGIFKGALSIRAPQITDKMKLAAANALAEMVTNPTPEKVIPGVFEQGVADIVARAVIQSI